MQRICVFAGSQEGNLPAYAQAAHALGRELAERGLALVYAGAGVGLMAVAAGSARASGGEVIGVALHDDQPCGGGRGPATSWESAASREERTALMADLADGFIALPGGLGTLDELFTLIYRAQLGLHAKPIGLLDIEGFFTPLLSLIARAESSGFIVTGRIPRLCTAPGAQALLDALAAAALDSQSLPVPCKEVAR
jgi:uncharacterized protein (TIGR00730 family)